jgi:hypothetical protein
MIKLIEDNNVFEAISLMNKSTNDNQYEFYERNEAVWIEYFLSLVKKQKEGSPHALVIGDYDKTNKLRGFLSALSFINYYNNQYVMDVKDCIVNNDYNNAFVVYRLFDTMIAHTKKHGGKHWRADSVRDEDKAMEYGRFLQKRYNSKLHVSVRGEIQENKDETI